MKIKHVFVLFTLLAISLFLAQSCKSDKKTKGTENQESHIPKDSCASFDTTLQVTYVVQYTNNWDSFKPDLANSFFNSFEVPLDIFSLLVNDYPYFRIIYGLKTPNASEQSLIIVPLNELCSNVFPSGKALLIDKDAVQLVDSVDAISYSDNWQAHFNISRIQDTFAQTPSQKYVVPIAYNFNTKVFDRKIKNGNNYFTVFWGLEPVGNSITEAITAASPDSYFFRFMLILHGTKERNILPYEELVKEKEFYLNFASPCPPFCDDNFD